MIWRACLAWLSAVAVWLQVLIEVRDLQGSVRPPAPWGSGQAAARSVTTRRRRSRCWRAGGR